MKKVTAFKEEYKRLIKRYTKFPRIPDSEWSYTYNDVHLLNRTLYRYNLVKGLK